MPVLANRLISTQTKMSLFPSIISMVIIERCPFQNAKYNHTNMHWNLPPEWTQYRLECVMCIMCGDGKRFLCLNQLWSIFEHSPKSKYIPKCKYMPCTSVFFSDIVKVSAVKMLYPYLDNVTWSILMVNINQLYHQLHNLIDTHIHAPGPVKSPAHKPRATGFFYGPVHGFHFTSPHLTWWRFSINYM